MNKAALVIWILLLGVTGVSAQNKQPGKVNITFHSDYANDVKTSQRPEFPGGHWELKKYFVQKFEANPELDFKKRAWIKAVVSPQGTVTALEVIGESNSLLLEELRQITAGMPRWKPGLINGHPVKTSYSFQPYGEN